MYKIFINETPLLLLKTKEAIKFTESNPSFLSNRYSGKTKFLLSHIDLLEKSQRLDGIVIHHDDLKLLKKDFISLYKTIKAAGGLVFNAKREILAIYRRDFWDLPKGKIDPGEKKKAAAVREVQEETGVETIELENKIITTYHTYRQKTGKRILKKTYWYNMKTTDTVLIPQAEEDIEKAQWVDPDLFMDTYQPIYKNIQEVIKQSGR